MRFFQQALINRENLFFAPDAKDLVLQSLGGLPNHPDVKENPDGSLNVTGKALSTIRSQALSYLNTLEIVFTAWRHGVGDQEILKQELAFLFSKTPGRGPFKNLRELASGGKGYPAIEAFAEGNSPASSASA